MQNLVVRTYRMTVNFRYPYRDVAGRGRAEVTAVRTHTRLEADGLHSSAQEPFPDGVEPLRRFGRLHTRDVDEAQSVVSEVFEPHSLRPLESTPLNARMNAVQTGDVTIGYLTYGLPTRIRLPANDRWYHVNVTLRGGSRVSRSDGATAVTAGRRGAAILLPHREQRIHWDADTEQLAIRIPRDPLEDHLATLLNRSSRRSLDLDLAVDLTTPDGQSLLRALEYTTTEWDTNGVLTRSAAARRHLEQLVLTSLLMAAGGPHRQLLDELGPGPADFVARTKEYIHEHARSLPTLSDLLRVAGVSARTLQTRFREEVGVGPIQYLREVRLRRVHEALRHPTPETNVTDVAIEWGFYHLGRFADQYRQRYGESPSATLRRARARMA